MRVVPVANMKSLKPRDRAAEVNFTPGNTAVATASVGHAVTFMPPLEALDLGRYEPAVPGGYSRDTLDSIPDRGLAPKLAMEREVDPQSPKVRQLEQEIQQRAAPKAKRTARAAFDTARVGDVATGLRTAPTRDAARSHLTGLSIAQLKQVAGHLGVTLPARPTKAQAVDGLVEVAGRRLDADAIRRMGR